MAALKDLVQNLQAKINVAAGAATPEELAYLSSAVEKIGGRASIFDFVDFVDDKKNELSLDVDQTKQDAVDSINAVFSNALTQLTELINTSSNSLTSTASQASADLDDQITAITTTAAQQIVDLVNQANANISNESDAAVAAVSSAASTAVGQIYGSRSRLYFLCSM